MPNQVLLNPTDLWRDYHARRMAWVAHNFPTTDGGGSVPMLETVEGVIEEIGELAHCHLKKKQSIRGTHEEHDAGMKDAVGDATVYLWGVTSRMEDSFVNRGFWVRVVERATDTNPLFQERVLMLSKSVGEISESVLYRRTQAPLFKRQVANFVGDLVAFCNQRGWNYHQIVYDTWNEVEKRDWQRFPKDGLTE